jgi:hypothetical protein
MNERVLRLYLAVARLGRDQRGSIELSVTTILMAVAAVTALTVGAMFSGAIIQKAGDVVNTITQ